MDTKRVFLVHYIILLIKRKKWSMRKCCRNVCQPLCQLLVAFLFYIGVIAILVLLTLFFNVLAKNGLSSSGLGSVFLSFLPPAIVFVLTLRLRSEAGSNRPPNSEDGGSVPETPNSNDTADFSTRNPSESTPLLLNTTKI